MVSEPFVSIFTQAHADQRSLPFNNRGRTVRMVLSANIATCALAVRLANYYGEADLPIGKARIGLCDAKGKLCTANSLALTVQGQQQFVLPVGETVLCDTLPIQLHPGDYFAISLYYPSPLRVASGNRCDCFTQRSRLGDYCEVCELPKPGLLTRLSRTAAASGFMVQATSVCEVLAQSSTPHRVLACFGDSIVQQGNWTVPLRKLLAKRYPGEVSLCNLGIGGNRLLGDAAPSTKGLYGLAGVRRFAREVLELQGLRYVVLALGVNDIGLPGYEGVPNTDLPGLPAYSAAMQELADSLHAQGVRVYAATLTPRTLQPPFDEEREALRQMFNEWIRSAACFDAVLDFDKALRREDGLPGMKDRYALADGLHPSPYGGLWMAKSIDLSLFGGDAL